MALKSVAANNDGVIATGHVHMAPLRALVDTEVPGDRQLPRFQQQ